MRIRAAVASALVGAALLVAPAGAGGGLWHLDASANATSELRLGGTTSLDLERLFAQIALGLRPADSLVRKAGRNGGVVIGNAHGSVAFGLLRYDDRRLLVAWGHEHRSRRHAAAGGARQSLFVLVAD